MIPNQGGLTGGDEVYHDFQRARRDRLNWEGYWERIARVVWPDMRNTFQNSHRTKGQENTFQQVDATPQIALSRFRAIMASLLTPESQKWHSVRASIPELNKQRRVAEWFEIVNDTLFQYRLSRLSGFKPQSSSCWAGVGAFGTAALFVDKLDGARGLRYKAIHAGELFLRENHQGRVDTVFRLFRLTGRQAKQRWKDLPKALEDAIRTNPEQEHEFVHRVRPNVSFDPEALDDRSMAFESVYLSVTGKEVLETGGFQTMPYPTSRHEIAPNEVYGRSPAMLALNAINTLNAQKRVVLTQGHRAANPIILSSDDGLLDQISLRPGAIITGAVNQEGDALVQPFPTGDVNLGRDMMEDERAIINDAFLVNLFQILVQTSDRMTATEVLERAQEKGMLLAPSIGAQHEFLGDMIDREINVLSQQGLLPPLPPELAEVEDQYTVEFDNPVTRSARSGEVAGLFRVLETVVPIINVTQDPGILDYIKLEEAMPDIMQISGTPLRWTATLEEVQQIRQSRAQQQERQQQAQEAPGQAALLKAAADAKSKGLPVEQA